jgi:hypothetical protein
MRGLGQHWLPVVRQQFLVEKNAVVFVFVVVQVVAC